MNLKQIHIKYRFYLQLALFVLFMACLAFSTYQLSQKASRAQKSTLELYSLVEESENAFIQYVSFLYNLNSTDEFYQTGSNSNTRALQASLQSLEDTLQVFSNKNRFAARLAKLGWNDSLRNALEAVQANFQLTSLTLKELGNKNSGQTGHALASSNQIKLLLRPYPYPSLHNELARLQFAESEFIFSKDQQAYNDALEHLELLQYDPNLGMLDFSIQDEIQQHAETYKNYLSLIQASLNNLGSIASGQGLLPDMEHSLRNLENQAHNYQEHAQMEQEKYSRNAWLAGIFLLLLIATGYLYQLYRFYASVYNPLESLSDFSVQLAKGHKKVTALETRVPAEYVHVFTHLNEVYQSIQKKRDFVDNLLKQNFDSELTLQGKHDQFGKTLLALKESMRKARNEELKYAEENQKRQYQNEGIAKFSEIMRSHSDSLSELADEFIKNIVRYLEAIQGGLFLIDEEKPEVMNLAAAFAYNRKKYLSRTIKIGETLVGTCAQEKKTTHLNELPENYIEITSGLGETPPSNLLLVPIMHEELLIGVLEMASLKAFQSIQIQLCEKICDSLASTIINARISTRTAALLEKSQQQAAEMAEQEEEMRQNMEELQATQEESQRREEELEGFLEAIDQSFYVLEYNTSGTIIKVNQRFLYLTNLSIDKIIGKTHREIFGSKSKVDSAFFAKIADGNIVDLTEVVIINDKKLELKNTFSPEKDRSGETIKILNIMTVIM